MHTKTKLQQLLSFTTNVSRISPGVKESEQQFQDENCKVFFHIKFSETLRKYFPHN